MKAASRLVILTIFAASLAACDSTPFLRDDYMGKKLIEPELLPQRVPRDQDGNPQLQTQARELESFWRKLKFWQTDPQ
ncbi:MAG: hypothetical protein QGF20_04810 [Alphaproteobacteria bacterium]|nr:hypothetical protein [Alphaproteobacteria bacterium]